MRTSKIDLVFCVALVISVLCGAVAFAIPYPAPCGPQCREINLRYTCASGNAQVLSKSHCFDCDTGCAVGGDTTMECKQANDAFDVDVYSNGVQACRACNAGDTYIEASLYQGTYQFTLTTFIRWTCVPKPADPGPPIEEQ